ncbi:MAG: methyltransferase domain-containing protein [Myxococcota bacterium]
MNQLPYKTKSHVQWIELIEDEHGHLVLVLDGNRQFHGFDEHRYHEAFAIPAFTGRSEPRRNALICGGGDGLLAQRVLQFPGIESLTLVEICPEVVKLAQEHHALVSLNRGALQDDRVQVVVDDAVDWVAGAQSDSLDVVFADFPDATVRSLEPLYGEAFYRECCRVLRPDGVFVGQVRYTEQYFATVAHRISNVFEHARPYRVRVPTHVVAGFVMASASAFDEFIEPPAWSRSLTVAGLSAMFEFAPDERAYVSTPLGRDSLSIIAARDARFIQGLKPKRLDLGRLRGGVLKIDSEG